MIKNEMFKCFRCKQTIISSLETTVKETDIRSFLERLPAPYSQGHSLYLGFI